MKITRPYWRIPRQAAVGIAAGGLIAGLLAVPAAADTAPEIGPIADRVAAVTAWRDGGDAVKRAAETALTGSDADVSTFLASGRQAASAADLRATVEGLVAVAGPQVRAAAQRALAGSTADAQAFLATGYKHPFEDDQRLKLTQIMSSGGPAVRKAAGLALDGGIDTVNAFLATGRYRAQEDDDRLKLSKLQSTGGPEVRAAASLALNGTVDDIREFLRYGYQTAAAHDAETLTVSQLVDLTQNAVDQAGEQARAASEAADKALAASALAKQSAEKAAAETKAAKGDAKKASEAAARAADAAKRAAAAAKAASDAADRANAAAGQAADAAADAARASALAGNAAAQAQDAATKAAGNAADAQKAKDAAVAAKKLAGDAKTVGERAQWAVHASDEAGKASAAAQQAADNSDAAAAAALDAANQAGVSDEARDRARNAANNARSAAAEAKRACAQVATIAAEAKAAAADAQRAADSSSGHAAAAAAAAEEAAAHAGDAARAAATAQAAAAAAKTAADTASQAASQAHTVADIARASDTERLASRKAAEVASAQEAYFDEAAKAKQAAWESGKASQLAAETQQLLTDATAPGVDPSVAVAKGRLVAVRLLTAGGPWTQIAAQTALEGHDADVLAFLSSDLALGRERDDRSAAAARAAASTTLPQRLAAETASVGTLEQVHDFLAHGTYPGKDDDDRLALTKIMSSGGPRVRAAAGEALNGTIDDVRAFLATGQYTARDDDNRLAVTQALSAGGPEVQAAAQAVLSGPTSGFAPFLAIGLPRARQRDAANAAHIAAIASALQTIDEGAALSRQYAAQAAQSYATARGAASEAAGYANQAQTSATEAADWAAKAAESARQAKASADQAAAYAAQARAAVDRADDAVSRADYSAAQAAVSAGEAHDFAAKAKESAEKARAAKLAAQASAAEAHKAAIDAYNIAYQKMQDGNAAGEEESRSAMVSDDGHVSFVQSVPRGDVQYKIVKENSEDVCSKGYSPWGPGGRADVDIFGPPPGGVSLGPWHHDASGKTVCDFQATVKVTGTFDYYLRTCPEANLTIAACQGKYATWDVLQLAPQTVDAQVETTLQAVWEDWRRAHTTSGLLDEMGAQWWGGIKKCFTNPFGFDADCAWSVAMVIPVTDLVAAGKVVLAYRVAVETGIGIESATAAVIASLGTIKGGEALAKINATTKAVKDIRAALAEGKSADEALAALGKVKDVDPALVDRLATERDIAVYGRTCPTVLPGSRNSFPAGTEVLMGDGTTRPIETIRVGEVVTAADPVTGASGPHAVTNTIYTPDDLNFTELTVDPGNGQQGSVTATDHHPFWVESARAWTDAASVKVGDTLRTDTGATAQVASIRHWTALQPAYNLTVADLHTYYVMAGSVPLLTHNLDCFDQIQSIANRLPNWVKGAKTRGFILTPQADGSMEEGVALVSGYNGDKDAINSYFVSLGVPDGLSIVADVEVKLAWKMRNKGVENLEIVINKPAGPCTGLYSCTAAVPAILPEGYTLTVWYKDEFGVLAKDPVPLVGKAAPLRPNG
ncbi:DddA-like double-stranded DNA deaminase toxin [Streptomyces sp. NRRL B-24484]|uniref:DddA-like double-stranded DNA deaminase toxin n=1 Tax=Streptomyces sp. NRRL B-24484 TaxID=1463833 RepID=UPI0006939B38|nr:DddA-like double-stranded DNA deaminase toxin [Streptomyces sp. NRRL B-24484]